MQILQEALERTLHELPNKFLAQLISNKLAKQGIQLSDRERKLLAEHIQKKETQTFRLKRWRFWDHQSIKLELTLEDVQQAEQKFAQFLEAQTPNLIQSVIDDIPVQILGDLKRKWHKESCRQERQRAGFAKRLHARWKAPLESLKMLLTMTRELGASINDEVRNSPDHNCKNLIEVLTRCHARSCQITEEILCFLAAGYADGAMARWRTLHEVAVVALFIAERGESMAERYILYQAVESSKAMRVYQQCCERLGEKPFELNEMQALENEVENLKSKFGKEFGNEYGWAAQDLNISKPTFRNIEEAVKIDHLRPYYKMACHNVHAGPRGIFFKLGLDSQSAILLAGASNAGLADPGQSTAISIGQISTTLHILHPTLDHLVALKMILRLIDEIKEEFINAHNILESDGERIGFSVQRY